MESTQIALPLIDYVPLHLALQTPPAGGRYQVAAVDSEAHTGTEKVWVALQAGAHVRALVFTGPTVVALGDDQLQAELERLEQIRAAADLAIASIRGHLAFRRGG